MKSTILYFHPGNRETFVTDYMAERMLNLGYYPNNLRADNTLKRIANDRYDIELAQFNNQQAKNNHSKLA